MWKPIEELDVELRGAIATLKTQTGFDDWFEEQLKNKIKADKVLSVLNDPNHNIMVGFFNEVEMCEITKQILNYISIINEDYLEDEYLETLEEIKNKLQINKWFTENEMSSTNDLYVNYEKEEISEFIIIPNVMRASYGHYVCYKAPIQLLDFAQRNGIVAYNFESQREPSLELKYGNIIYNATIVEKNVLEITDKLKSGKFFPNLITWNILNTGEEEFEYNEEKHELRFKKSTNSKINIIDGYHRMLGLKKALIDNPNLDAYFILSIFNYPVETAQAYIIQENEGTKISGTKIKNMETDEYSALIKYIQSSVTSENKLLNNITDEYLELNDKLVLKSTFKLALEDNFSKDEVMGRSKTETGKYLIEFLSTVINYFKEDFDNKKLSQESRIVTFNNSFLGYIYLSLQFKNLDNWEDELYKFLDFAEENHYFVINNDTRKSGMLKTKFTDSTRKSIYKYFDSTLQAYQNKK